MAKGGAPRSTALLIAIGGLPRQHAARDQRKRDFSCPHDVFVTGVGFTDSISTTRSSKSWSPPDDTTPAPAATPAGAGPSGSSQHSHHVPAFLPVPWNVIARAWPPGLRESCVNTVPEGTER